MKTMKSLLAAALVTAAFSASAGYQYSDVGPYVSIDAGISSQSGVDVATSEQGATGVTLGYNIDRQMGVELTAMDLGRRTDSAYGVGTVSWSSKATSISAVARAELLNNVEFSAKLGLANTRLNATNGSQSGSLSATGLVVGVGADYRFDRHWSVKANLDVYPSFAGSSDPMGVVSVGLKYRF